MKRHFLPVALLMMIGFTSLSWITFTDDASLPQKVKRSSTFDRLVWNDEFDGAGMIDTTKWFHQTQLPNGQGWFNGELQHYTDRLDNSYVKDGMLHIVAKKEQFEDQGVTKAYTSARLNARYAFTYGRIEVRAKLPQGVGTWPAIWTLSTRLNETGSYWESPGAVRIGWPACGEIDIMEHWGKNQNFVQSAVHTASSYGGDVSNIGGQLVPDVSSAFHRYGLEWSADKMTFTVDDSVHYEYAPSVKNEQTWPFDADQYILLNIAIERDIDPAFDKSEMVVDYVRIYQE